MTTDRELMQQALDVLEKSRVFVTSREKIKHPEGTEWYDERIEALRARLAQPEQEPVAWRHWLQVDGERFPQLTLVPRTDKDDPLYTATPQREWQGLTNDEVNELSQLMVKEDKSVNWLTYAIEAKLKAKNG